MFKIGILGSGTVGKTLAVGLHSLGYDTMIGSRSVSTLEERKQEQGFPGRVGSFEEVGEFGDIIILAVKGSAAESALSMTGKEHLKGKVILDTTNPIDDLPPEDGVLQFFTGTNFSLMERLQSLFPLARFVKCFSCIGADTMIQPHFEEGTPTMFICGNDGEAKQIATEILTTCGFEAADMGSAKAAGSIESLCILRCIPGFTKGERNHAFKLLKK